MHEWLRKTMNAPYRRALPLLSFPCVSLMGVTVARLLASAELQAEGMRRVAERVPSAAAVSMMDLSVEAQAFGAAVRMSENEVPTIVGSLVQDEAGAEALRIPEVGAGRTGLCVEAVRLAVRSITDRPVFAGVIGPFSLAGRLMGVSEAMVNCYEEPDMVHMVLEKATDFLTDYIRALKAAGAHGVVMAEPLAGMLSPRLAEGFSEGYVREIAQAVRAEDFLLIYHNCGDNTVQMAESILRTGCDAYHFGDAIDMGDMLARFPKDVPVMGNVSPSAQFLKGTPETIRRETLRLLEGCREHPNFLLSSGCDIPPAAPWENIDAFFASLDEFAR